MLIRLAYLANCLLGRDVAGRTLGNYPEDNFLVVYPGSGGQWLRKLVGNLIDPDHPVTAANVMRRVPDLYHLSHRDFKKILPPRIVFTHECFDASYRGSVVYLVRDPRDVSVSIYEQRRNGGSLDQATSMEEFVSTYFMRTDEYQGGWAEGFSGSIGRGGTFLYRCRLRDGFLGTPASWGENVMSWVGTQGEHSKTFMMLRYEDLFSDPEGALTRLCEFLGLAASQKRVERAVAASREHAATTGTEPEAPGKWQAVLPEPAVRVIESAWGPVMTALGYSVQSMPVASTVVSTTGGPA